MSAKKKYKSAQDFRMAIQDKLLSKANKLGVDVQMLYRHTASSQFLARLFKNNDIDWALKGGHALELRLQQSRATKDIDLALRDKKYFDSYGKDQSFAIRELIIEKAKTDIGDYFIFNISEPLLDLVGTPYGGNRFSIEARIDGKVFSKFSLDIGIGDVWLSPDILELKNYLSEIGLNPGSISVISIEQHIAEKIHAYTLPRERFNSRVKDFIDLYLILKNENMNMEKLKEALTKTFERRKTHVLPRVLPQPHEFWKERFENLINKFQSKIDIESAFLFIDEYYRKITKVPDAHLE